MSGLAAEFTFLRPLWLLLLAPLVATGWALHRSRITPPASQRVAAPHLLPHLLVAPRLRPRVRPDQLLLPIGIVAIFALAGPSLRTRPAAFAEDRAAVVAVLRVDESMQSRDLAPSRLERARHKLHDLAAVREGAPLGLIAYRGSAHVVTPITRDTAVVEEMAAALEPSVMPREGDALVEALTLARRLLAEAGMPGSILVLSDGVAPDARSQLTAPGDVDIQFLALVPASTPADDIEKAARILDAPVERPTADDTDVQRLAARAESLASVPGEDRQARREDDGWWLVVLLVPAVLVWSRRGWSIRWP